MGSSDKQMKAYSDVVKKAWADPAYKKQLLSDPDGTLRDAGFSVPQGSKVQVVENGPGKVHFVLPQQPPSDARADLPFGAAHADLPFYEGAMLPFHSTILLPFFDASKGQG